MPSGFSAGYDKALKTVILLHNPTQFYILLNFGMLEFLIDRFIDKWQGIRQNQKINLSEIKN